MIVTRRTGTGWTVSASATLTFLRLADCYAGRGRLSPVMSSIQPPGYLVFKVYHYYMVLLVLSFHLEVGVTNVTFSWRVGTRLSLVMRAASPRHEFDLTTTQPISRVTI